MRFERRPIADRIRDGIAAAQQAPVEVRERLGRATARRIVPEGRIGSDDQGRCDVIVASILALLAALGGSVFLRLVLKAKDLEDRIRRLDDFDWVLLIGVDDFAEITGESLEQMFFDWYRLTQPFRLGDMTDSELRSFARAETRRNLRALEQIVVTLADGLVDLRLHWGGEPTHWTDVKYSRTEGVARRWLRWATPADLAGWVRAGSAWLPWMLRPPAGGTRVDPIRTLAQHFFHRSVASMLKRRGRLAGQGRASAETWVRMSGGYVPVFRSVETAARGEVTLEEAARSLGVSTTTVLRLINSGVIEAYLVCKGGAPSRAARPWTVDSTR